MTIMSYLDLEPLFEAARNKLTTKKDKPVVWEWSTKTEQETIRLSKSSKGKWIDQSAVSCAPGGVWADYRGNFQPCANPGFSINGVMVIINDALPEDEMVLRGSRESVRFKLVESPH